jgi:hypothetical protein
VIAPVNIFSAFLLAKERPTPENSQGLLANVSFHLSPSVTLK